MRITYVWCFGRSGQPRGRREKRGVAEFRGCRDRVEKEKVGSAWVRALEQ